MVKKNRSRNPCHMLAFAVVVSLVIVVRAYMAIWAATAGGWIAVSCSNDALTSLNVKWGREAVTMVEGGGGGRTKNHYTAEAVHHLELHITSVMIEINCALSS